MRRRGRTDAPQKAIVEALRQAGASVLSLADIGNGCPDLLVSHPATGLLLLEVKDGAKPPSARTLTDDQVRWRLHWNGPQPITVLSVDDALKALGICPR